MFKDRTAAGQALADRLQAVVAGPCVVAPIPRGGVTVALPIIERLKAPIAMVYARKLTAAIAPELAFGAVDEDGETIVDADTVAMLGLGPEDVEAATRRVSAEIRRRIALYRVPPLARFLPGRAVVLVDDGLATGLTMRAAVAYARRHGATDITVAVPCASEHAAERFRREADRVVALVVDPAFMAVGAYYVDFSPVTDAEVAAMLETAQEHGPRAA
jgi:predicted phosphoribosyltransferase